MASTVIFVPKLCFGLYPRSFPNSPTVSVFSSSSIPFDPYPASQISAISSSAKIRSDHLLKLKHNFRASAEGVLLYPFLSFLNFFYLFYLDSQFVYWQMDLCVVFQLLLISILHICMYQPKLICSYLYIWLTWEEE